jgi:hypothetical protein
MSLTVARGLSTQEVPMALEYDAEDRDDCLETSSRILALILNNSLKKYSDTMGQLSLGTPEFLAVISNFVKSGQTVQMCLPAFHSNQLRRSRKR